MRASLRGLTALLLYVGTRQRKQQITGTFGENEDTNATVVVWKCHVWRSCGCGQSGGGKKRWRRNRSPKETLKQSMGQWESRYRTLVSQRWSLMDWEEAAVCCSAVCIFTIQYMWGTGSAPKCIGVPVKASPPSPPTPTPPLLCAHLSSTIAQTRESFEAHLSA